MPKGRYGHDDPQRAADSQLAKLMGELYADPLGYVMACFPWDKEASTRVVKLPEEYRERFPGCEHGPDRWACEFLDQLGQEIARRGFHGPAVEPIRFATVTGHETGKTTLVAWLVKFIMDTRPMSKGSVTAMTDEQLRTKTWAEVGKWHYMSLTAHWFNYSASRGSMSLTHVNPRWTGSWRCDAKTAREEKSESFAGQHAPTATSFYIYDEASGIANKLFEVREGGLTSGEPMVFDFGNGTRNSGAFYEEFMGRRKHRWITRSIDSRAVSITNKDKIAQDAEDYGEESDFFKVRWRGLFPSTGTLQFISAGSVEEAMMRPIAPGTGLDPWVIGVDCARFGDDDSVIWPRRGTDARSFGPASYKGLDTVQLTGKIIETFQYFANLGQRPRMIFVDEGSMGAGVVDQLRHLGYPVTGINFGSRPNDPTQWRYRSDEIWGGMRAAIVRNLVLPERTSQHGERIFSDLTGREFGYMLGGQRVHLETKRDMKARGLSSPDFSDALAVTYAQEMPQMTREDQVLYALGKIAVGTDFDPFELTLAGEG